jgi:hypothetical protein
VRRAFAWQHCLFDLGRIWAWHGMHLILAVLYNAWHAPMACKPHGVVAVIGKLAGDLGFLGQACRLTQHHI